MVRADSSLQAERAKPAEGREAPGAGAAVVIRSAYDRLRVRVGLACLASEDRTQQAFRDESDINVLMKRYEATGILPVGRDLPPQFGDVTAIDFTSSMLRVAEVSGVFSMLDARTRARFMNDPAVMLDFLSDPVNHDEAVRMGLMVKPEVSNERREDRAGVESVGRSGASGAEPQAAGQRAAEADRRAESGVAGGSAGVAGVPGRSEAVKA